MIKAQLFTLFYQLLSCLKCIDFGEILYFLGDWIYLFFLQSTVINICQYLNPCLSALFLLSQANYISTFYSSPVHASLIVLVKVYGGRNSDFESLGILFCCYLKNSSQSRHRILVAIYVFLQSSEASMTFTAENIMLLFIIILMVLYLFVSFKSSSFSL